MSTECGKRVAPCLVTHGFHQTRCPLIYMDRNLIEMRNTDPCTMYRRGREGEGEGESEFYVYRVAWFYPLYTELPRGSIFPFQFPGLRDLFSQLTNIKQMETTNANLANPRPT